MVVDVSVGIGWGRSAEHPGLAPPSASLTRTVGSSAPVLGPGHAKHSQGKLFTVTTFYTNNIPRTLMSTFPETMGREWLDTANSNPSLLRKTIN